MQKRHPDPAGQALPHEIASAAEASESAAEARADATADAAHAQEPTKKHKDGLAPSLI